MKYGRYEVVKELGRGTMGVVYQAHDPQIDRMVALKVLRPDRVVSQDFVLRFLREAKAIGRISHANIVTVYDVGPGPWYDLHCHGVSRRPAAERNDQGRTLPPDSEAMRRCVPRWPKHWVTPTAKGLPTGTSSPPISYLTPDNRTKLTDFGIARIEDPDAAQQTQAGDILGTPVYMAPEQVMGQKADGRTDLYALGVIALRDGGRKTSVRRREYRCHLSVHYP
jgi:serine/threonine protein kinase